jgi:hypothetical protein
MPIINYGKCVVSFNNKYIPPPPPPLGAIALTFKIPSTQELLIGTAGRSDENVFNVAYDWDLSLDGKLYVNYSGVSSLNGTINLGTVRSGYHTVILKPHHGNYNTNWIHGLGFWGMSGVGSSNYLTKIEGKFPTVLTDYCYYSMFNHCDNLTDIDIELPALTLKTNCYAYMFSDCVNLKNTPNNLPATTLDVRCYYYMFYNCKKITNTPNRMYVLRITDECCCFMFYGCSSLVNPTFFIDYDNISTKVFSCFWAMYKKCTGMVSTPRINTLFPRVSYNILDNLFEDCTSLREIYAKGGNEKTEFDGYWCMDWVKNVSPTGTFHTLATSEWYISTNGIPPGWTRINDF